jgi:hypothetical protein
LLQTGYDNWIYAFSEPVGSWVGLGHICVKEKEVKQKGNLKIRKKRKENDEEKEQNRRTQKAEKHLGYLKG